MAVAAFAHLLGIRGLRGDDSGRGPTSARQRRRGSHSPRGPGARSGISHPSRVLLLPRGTTLSIGNMGQLAVHLLVSSSGERQVAYLDEPSVLPCAGNDAFGSDAIGDLALALEGWGLDI
ncbi:hypothetical protein GUJ93_ZPchr0005g14489 [Zizania palustris]|uniref:Uncharacterized protein n=1 Tax=Zizania palustris TaxID=103762 RepID=A0A8J5T3U1_ZIZPA|nr:hypothetical protein GUJ93_ZPchr0005g14489 [Zizania palustris]